jgi:hypothetical protein
VKRHDIRRDRKVAANLTRAMRAIMADIKAKFALIDKAIGES